MRKFIIFSCITGSLVIILGQFGFFEALLAFLVAGAIPGTSYSIPSSIMYGFLVVSISLVILLLIGPALFDFIYTLTDRKSQAKKHEPKLPKRRYGQI
jgi:hypothetical protein